VDVSHWQIEPASTASLAEVGMWRYDPPYDFYDDDGKPVRNPERFFAVRDADGALVGSLYFEPRDGAIFYGLGLRPDLTGQGLGLEFVLRGLRFAHEQFPGKRVILDVADFNRRAQTVYERAGFRATGRHVTQFGHWGDITFIDMEEP
jgi:RimJ/RimL family protein N-acetyltransferase